MKENYYTGMHQCCIYCLPPCRPPRLISLWVVVKLRAAPANVSFITLNNEIMSWREINGSAGAALITSSITFINNNYLMQLMLIFVESNALESPFHAHRRFSMPCVKRALLLQVGFVAKCRGGNYYLSQSALVGFSKLVCLCLSLYRHTIRW